MFATGLPRGSARPRGEERAGAVLCLLIAATTAALYARTAGFAYVFDDAFFIEVNPGLAKGLTWAAVRWAFTSFYHYNWHPIAWLAHLIDRGFLGTAPGPAHLVNAGLHAACAALLFITLRRMSGALLPSAFAAAAFAVHPLRVESVAWVTERKDVLSTIFWILAMGAYTRYARRPGATRSALVAALLALGLMTKAMLVTFPCALLLLDWWPLGRLRLGQPHGAPLARLLLEKLPLALLSGGAAAATILAQHEFGAVQTMKRYPVAIRIENALVTCVTYLGDTLWPVNLAAYYPYPETGFSLAKVLGAAVLLVLFSVLALAGARRAPELVTGWYWYLGTLVPVIGFIQVGGQSHADRYTYLPSIGLLIAVAWGARRFAGHFRPMARAMLVLAAFAVLAVLAAASWRQIGTWRDDVALFTRAVAVTRNNWLAENNLCLALEKQGDLDGALRHCQAAVEILPHYEAPRFNLAVCYTKLGRLDDAVREYRLVLQIKPDSVEALINLGALLTKLGERAAVIELYRSGVMRRPDLAVLHVNLANALSDAGGYEEALAHYREAVRLAPDNAGAHANRGVTYQQMGRLTEAAAEYREALLLDPGNVTAQRGLRQIGGAR